MMKRVMVTGPQPLYRLAVARLLESRTTPILEECASPFGRQNRDRLDLLVVCVSTENQGVLQQLEASPRLSAGRILLMSEHFGKRHRKLLAQQRIDLCLPLSIIPDQARYYLRGLMRARREYLINQVAADISLQHRFLPDLRDLTRSERRVLFNLQCGLSNQAIADRMNICLNTVKVHLAHACRKAGFRNRYQAAGFTSSLLSADQSLIRGGV